MRIRIVLAGKEICKMKDVEKLMAQREELLKEILEAPVWVNGSIVETIRKFKGKETPFYYLSQSVMGKNKITYISAKNLAKFKAAAIEGARLKMLMSELCTVNIKLIKAYGKND